MKAIFYVSLLVVLSSSQKPEVLAPIPELDPAIKQNAP